MLIRDEWETWQFRLNCRSLWRPSVGLPKAESINSLSRERELSRRLERLYKFPLNSVRTRSLVGARPRMIRAFLFDIGNVLLRFDFQVALEKLAHDSDPAAEKILELIDPVKAAYEGGRIPRDEFQAEVRAIMRYTGSDEDFIAAWEDIFTENQPMIELVGRLQGRYPLFLLSNTSDIHLDFILRRYPIFSAFDNGVYSFKVGASKPEREIYEIAVRDLGLVPGETFFIDDLLPNVSSAQEVGFQAHHYHHDQHDRLLADLKAAGVEP